jgi:hypothetical protein
MPKRWKSKGLIFATRVRPLYLTVLPPKSPIEKFSREDTTGWVCTQRVGVLPFSCLTHYRFRTGSSHYKDFEGINAGLEGLVFFYKALVLPFEVRDVFGCFGEDGGLGEISCSAETMEEEKTEDRGEMRINTLLSFCTNDKPCESSVNSPHELCLSTRRLGTLSQSIASLSLMPAR